MKNNKFRVWDVNFEDMFDADNIILDQNDSLSNQINDCDKYKFMQFTGLLDKNGKEVYEKDILRVKMGNDWQTKYNLVKNLWDLHLWINDGDNYYRVNEFEVVGSFYQNPELVENTCE